jgi:hypothetical protein
VQLRGNTCGSLVKSFVITEFSKFYRPLLTEKKCHAFLSPCDERVGFMGVVATHLDRPSRALCNRVHALMSHAQGCPFHDETPLYLPLGLNCENAKIIFQTRGYHNNINLYIYVCVCVCV